MKRRNIYGLYFSPTGTTKNVVSHIVSNLSHMFNVTYDLISINKPQQRISEIDFSDEDIVVVGFPVYAGRVPNLLLPFINKIRGNGAIGISVVLYGNRNYDDALYELSHIMYSNGFNIIASGAFVGQHSFSNILAKGRPDARDLNIISQFSNDIHTKICNELISSDIIKKESQTFMELYFKEKSTLKYFQPRDKNGNRIDIRKVKPITSESCNFCGRCIELCPMNAIDVKNPKNIIGICIKCGACVKYCPSHAKSFVDKAYLTHVYELEDKYLNIRGKIDLFLKVFVLEKL